MDGIGQAKAKKILQLRERKEDFNFYDVADVTQTELTKWIAQSKAGVVCITKPTAESSANQPAQAISDIMSTNELHPTLMMMYKSIKLLHVKVKFLKAEVVLKSEVDLCTKHLSHFPVNLRSLRKVSTIH